MRGGGGGRGEGLLHCSAIGFFRWVGHFVVREFPYTVNLRLCEGPQFNKDFFKFPQPFLYAVSRPYFSEFFFLPTNFARFETVY